MSIKNLIVRFIEEEGPKFGGQIEDYIRSIMGAKASNASRRCRELVKSGILERELCKVDGVPNLVVKYRLKPIINRTFSNKVSVDIMQSALL